MTRSTATPSFAPTSAASSEYRPPVGTKAATRVVKYLKSASGERPMRKPTSTPERAKKAPSEPPRRSQRVQGIGADGAQLPANFREPTAYVPQGAWESRPRNVEDVPLLADDEDDDAAAAEAAAKRGAVVAALAAKEAKKPSARTPMDAKAYRASLQSFALKEADVAKVTKDRTYSLAWLPSTDKLLIAAGDKSGRVGLWDVDDADGET